VFQPLEAGDPEARQILGAGLSRFTGGISKGVRSPGGISFEHVLGSRFLTIHGGRALKSYKHGPGDREPGALIVDLSAYDMPPFLLKKQDGTTCTARVIWHGPVSSTHLGF